MTHQNEKGENCEKCGVFVPGFEYQGCCSGHECGCGGRPIEPCLCVGCWNKELGLNSISHEDPLEGREPQYEDSMYIIVFALIGCCIVGISGIIYVAFNAFN